MVQNSLIALIFKPIHHGKGYPYSCWEATVSHKEFLRPGRHRASTRNLLVLGIGASPDSLPCGHVYGRCWISDWIAVDDSYERGDLAGERLFRFGFIASSSILLPNLAAAFQLTPNVERPFTDPPTAKQRSKIEARLRVLGPCPPKIGHREIGRRRSRSASSRAVLSRR